MLGTRLTANDTDRQSENSPLRGFEMKGQTDGVGRGIDKACCRIWHQFVRLGVLVLDPDDFVSCTNHTG